MSRPESNGWTGGQYSLWRALMGSFVLGLSVWQLVGCEGDVATLVLSGTAIALSLACILGWWDGPAALVLATLVGVIVFRDRELPTAIWPLVAVLLLHGLAPPAPFGSVMARGRTDPDGGWTLPTWLYRFAWGVLLLAMVMAAFDPRIETTEPIAGLLSRAGLVATTVLAAGNRTRSWAWLLAGLTGLVLAAAGTVPWILLAPVPAWLLALDPAWIAAGRSRSSNSTDPVSSESKPDPVAWLFYDGHCGLCHRFVRIVLAEDRDPTALRLAPLGGKAFREVVEPSIAATLPESIVVVTTDSRVLARSAAVLELGRSLGGCWRLLAGVARLVPRPLRDLGYDVTACIRHRLFPRPTEACPLLPPALRERFDLRCDLPPDAAAE
ncbi:MAG: DCC1-like thiol-disulfide oxidoreductase family protein [Planctomycetaceae bacterium]